jgi:hypothetical protein
MAADLDTHRSRRLSRIHTEVITALKAQGAIGTRALRDHISDWPYRDLRLALDQLRRDGVVELRGVEHHRGNSGVYVLVA